MKHNTTDNAVCDVAYTFLYDGAKRPTQVKVGNQTLSTTAYNADGTVQSAAYGNNGNVAYTYDAFKRVTGVKIDGGTQDRYTYAYNANGQVAHVTDNRLYRVAQSEYDLSNRPMRVKTHENGSHVYTGEVGYDVFGNLMEFTEKVGAGYTRYATAFGYDEENRPTTLTYGDVNNKLTQAYDAIGRINTRTLTVGGRAYNTSYTYEAGGYGAASTTPLIKSITQDGKTTTYTYDDAGNIQSVDTPFNPVQVEDLTGKLYELGGKRLYTKDENGLERILYAVEGKGQAQTTVSKVSYAYDKLGQLTRVDDPYDLTSGQQGTTTTYSYDLGGNSLEKRVFPYTQPSELPIGAVKVVPYAYADANWKDKLTSYNGTSITYDAIGNPLSDGTWAYAWESGRQLMSIAKTGTTVNYSYNADGLRTKKTVIRRMEDNSLITETGEYTLHGKQVVYLKKDGNNLHFYYDTQGRPAIVDFNGVKYGYVHNLQGDIVVIVDGSGNLMVGYTYDAWGKPLTKTGTLATTLGTLNPFRYRGYVFDEETGLYYLRSRYYNLTWGRFVNADTVLEKPGKLLVHNKFSYCRQNLVMGRDSSGMYDPDERSERKLPHQTSTVPRMGGDFWGNLWRSFMNEHMQDVALGFALNGWKHASDLLFNALGAGEDLHFDSDSDLSQQIANSPYVSAAIVAFRKSGEKLGTVLIDFKSGDLHYALGHATLYPSKNASGKVAGTLYDYYDYAPDKGYGATATLVNMAYDLQQAGYLYTYNIYADVNFN